MHIICRTLFLIALLFSGLLSQAYADPRSPTSCTIASNAITLDGGTLYYSAAGNGPQVLLLHGLFAQKEQWNEMLCRLAAAGYTALAPDLPGYGKSVDFPLGDYALEQQVLRLRQFLDALGTARIDLAGNSMGGAIAALYAQRYPQQVRTLAFIGSPLGATDWSLQVKEAIYQGINPFIPIDHAQLDLELRLLFVSPPNVPDTVKDALIRDYVERNRHYQQVWDIVNLYDTLLAVPLRLRLPTLILWGQKDAIFAVQGAERLRARLPRSTLVRLPNAGHLPHLENPEETATVYLGFLKSYSGSGWR